MLHRRTLALGLSLAALAGSLLAAPAAGATTARWVDDDGTRGRTGCDGRIPVSTSIQDTVDDAATGDTVKVCPGVYEPVTIATVGLKLIAVKPGKAVIRPVMAPGARPTLFLPYAVTVRANNVLVQGFKLALGQTASCTQAGGVDVQTATGVVVKGNRILGRSDGQSVSCGLVTGINYGNSSGRIVGNVIRNMTSVGIVADGTGPVAVNGNTVRWGHPTQTCPAVSCAGARPTATILATGIAAYRLKATIVGNTIVKEAGATGTGHNAFEVFDAKVSLRSNRVTGWDDAVFGTQLRGLVAGNTFRKGAGSGISLKGNGVSAQYVVRDNRVTGYAISGIELTQSVGNTIKDNDFSINPGTDCFDLAVPTTNTWTGNVGNDQNQPGLCRRPR